MGHFKADAKLTKNILIILFLARFESNCSEYMPAGYDKVLRPGFRNADLADNVSFEMFIHAVGPIEEAQMRMTLDVYFRRYWTDERLIELYEHISNKTNSTGFVSLGSDYLDLIWLPDIYWIDALDVTKPGVDSESMGMRLHSDGSVSFSSRLLILFRCQMDLKYFPMDVQTCSLCFQSYVYHDGEQKMSWRSDEISFSKDQITSNFIVGPNPQVSLETFDFGSEYNFSSLCVAVELSRKVNIYIINMFVPSISLVLLSWVGFWIDKKAVPARAGLCITTVLAQITLITGTANQFPGIADLKLADLYLIVNFFYVFCSLIEFAIVSYGPKEKPPKGDLSKPSAGPDNADHRASTSLLDETEVFFSNNTNGETKTSTFGKNKLTSGGVVPFPREDSCSRSSDEHKSLSEDSKSLGEMWATDQIVDDPVQLHNQDKTAWKNPLMCVRGIWVSLKSEKFFQYWHKENADEISKWFFPATFLIWNIIYAMINLKFSGRI